MKTECERRKIKNVEDSGKPVVVFSTNCEFSFSFCLASFLSQCVKNAQNEQHTLASGQERKGENNGRDIKYRSQMVRLWLLSPSPLSELAPACFASS